MSNLSEILLQHNAEVNQGLNELAGHGTALEQTIQAIHDALMALIGADEEYTIVAHKYGTDTGEIEKTISDGEAEWKDPRNELRQELRAKIAAFTGLGAVGDTPTQSKSNHRSDK